MILGAVRGKICSDTQGPIKYTYPIENSATPYFLLMHLWGIGLINLLDK